MDDFLKNFFPGVWKEAASSPQDGLLQIWQPDTCTIHVFIVLGALVFTFLASFMTGSKGRSASILCGSISFFCGAVINACAMNIAMLIIGRLLLGVGIGFSNQVCSMIPKPKVFCGTPLNLFTAFFFLIVQAVPLYQSEMSPAKTRGRYNQLFQLKPA